MTAKWFLKEHVKAEMHQSVVELGARNLRRRQKRTAASCWESNQDMKAVVDHIIADTNEGLGV
jgi:hypothetical protein